MKKSNRLLIFYYLIPWMKPIDGADGCIDGTWSGL